MKRNSAGLVISLITALFFVGTILGNVKLAFAYDAGNIIADGDFTNWRTLDASGVQQFLNSKAGTRLRTFSEGGRSAAQIIADAARANGINPFVILATIQKEESLVESNTNFDFRVNWAMGYGVCDNCSLDDPNVVKYRGFTNQINNGAWQLKYNYNHWAANGSVWNVGKTMIIDGQSVRFSNRSTSSLYRYTPHLSGNQNFNAIYNRYKTFRGQGSTGANGSYEAQYVTQGPRAGAGAPNVTLSPNQKFIIWVNYRNTGGTIWYKAGTNSVRIGNSSPQDRGSVFMNGNNVRGTLVQTAVRPGQIGTFQLRLTAPSAGGTYTERFRPLAEHVAWMGEEATWTFNVSGGRAGNQNGGTASSVVSTSISNNNNAQFSAMGPRTGVGSPGSTFSRGQSVKIWVNYVNTGSTTWYKNGINPAHLGTANPQDRGSAFLQGKNIRGTLVQTAVKPGAVGTFVITVTAPNTPGTYQESFRPLIEHVTWMGDPVTWTFNVR